MMFIVNCLPVTLVTHQRYECNEAEEKQALMLTIERLHTEQRVCRPC
jgi:hypothetical protein